MMRGMSRHPLRLAMLSLAALLFAGVSSASMTTLEKVRSTGKLVWGADIQGGEPYVYEDPKNPSHLIGFEVDIVAELAKRLGVQVVFHQTAWSNLVPSLERSDFDIAICGLEATSDRQDRVLMSRPYYVYAETLAVRKGAKERSLEDLAGKRVATLNQTYAHDLLLQKKFEPALYEGVQEPYLDLANGKVDGVLLDNIIADLYGCPTPGVQCVPGDVARGVYVALMRKTDGDFKAAVDGALEGMIADGSLRKILEKWKLWDHRQTEPLPEIAMVNRPRAMTKPEFVLFLRGAVTTVKISTLSFLIAVPLGFLLAALRVYSPQPGRLLSATYVEIFRGTPVLLQLYVLYFGIAPYIRLGAVEAAILGLGLNYAAYESEIYRGAILAIPRGQSEAAASLGLSVLQTLRHVMMPQAFRIALPAMTNDFIALLKDSSLVGVIAVIELTKRMTIAAVDMRSWLAPGLLCASLYFTLSFPLARAARHMEKKLHRDQHPRPH